MAASVYGCVIRFHLKMKYTHTWDKVFKNGPIKICGRQPLKNLLGVFLNTLSQMSCYLIFKIKIKLPLLIDNSLRAADELQGYSLLLTTMSPGIVGT